jgi:hypothetical protein
LIQKFFWQTSNWVSQNAEIGADLESAKKVAKNAIGKSYQRKNNGKWTFYFYNYVQKVGQTFFSVNFVAFYATDSNSASNLCFMLFISKRKKTFYSY